MRFYIRELQRDFGITTVYVTHDQAEALVLADRIAVMMNGVVHQLDEPRAIYDRPASALVASFIGLTNLIAGEVEQSQNGALSVRTRWGVLSARGDTGRTVGEQVMVCVRPEAFTAARSDAEVTSLSRDGSANTLVGRVSESAYLGSLVDYRVETDDGLAIRCQSSTGEEFTAGELVSVRFDAARTWVVDRTPVEALA